MMQTISESFWRCDKEALPTYLAMEPGDIAEACVPDLSGFLTTYYPGSGSAVQVVEVHDVGGHGLDERVQYTVQPIGYDDVIRVSHWHLLPRTAFTGSRMFLMAGMVRPGVMVRRVDDGRMSRVFYQGGETVMEGLGQVPPDSIVEICLDGRERKRPIEFYARRGT